MPVRNKLYGVYKLLELGGNKYVVESANRNREMEAQPKNFVQGTAKARIMDVGGLSETISVNLPILVGGGASLDGRALVNTYIARALDETNETLPLITGATIKVGQEGATVSANFLSDGRPSSGAFKVTNFPIDNVPGKPLDPTYSDPTRVARFYDFRCRIGGIIYYIMEASIEIRVNTDKKYFIAGAENTWGTTQFVATAMNTNQNPLASNDANNPYNFGTQFPFIGVTGIQVTGSGQAAVELSDYSVPVDYDFEDYGNAQTKWEAINVDLSSDGGGDGNHYELTWQRPGEVRTAADQLGDPSAQGFLLEIWNPNKVGGAGWEALLDTAVVDLSNALVTKSDFRVSVGILTVNFGFINWVK